MNHANPNTAPDSGPRLIAVVGGESTGKSTLVSDLASALPGLAVPETLREWVAEHGRVPDAAEQWQVLTAQAGREQAARHRAAELGLAWVISDGSLLMTAVYSMLYYDDPDLVAPALAAADNALVVWCDADIPWVADSGQRDGVLWRDRAQRIIGELLSGGAPPSSDANAQNAQSDHLRWIRVQGSRAHRVAAVQAALAEWDQGTCAG